MQIPESGIGRKARLPHLRKTPQVRKDGGWGGKHRRGGSVLERLRLGGGGDPELLSGSMSAVPGVPGVPIFKKRRERFKQKKINFE
jgi:hypothetical protein